MEMLGGPGDKGTSAESTIVVVWAVHIIIVLSSACCLLSGVYRGQCWSCITLRYCPNVLHEVKSMCNVTSLSFHTKTPLS